MGQKVNSAKFHFDPGAKKNSAKSKIRNDPWAKIRLFTLEPGSQLNGFTVLKSYIFLKYSPRRFDWMKVNAHFFSGNTHFFSVNTHFKKKIFNKKLVKNGKKNTKKIC
jgi:hypothetical protein